MTLTFKQATDALLVGLSHDELAEALGCSVASIRQARLPRQVTAYRSPPQDWEAVVKRLAHEKAQHFARLANELRNDPTRK